MTSSPSIRVAVDCMGGDYAPREIVKGAILGALLHRVSVQLVGHPGKIQAELDTLMQAGVSVQKAHFEIVEALENIEMNESPAVAIRKKKNASVVVACKCVAKGESQGVVAVGNTGAAMAAALFNMGRIEGIDRPAIAVVLPSVISPCVLLDVGANADCIPEMLYQFARMGSVFSQAVLNVEKPRVGLMNIGEESSKGNAFSLSTYKLLEQHDSLNFVGNIEGRHLFDGSADVVVCDGFTGNVIIKTSEGVGKLVMDTLKDEARKSLKVKAGGLLLKPALKEVKRRVSDEDFGGALLLGVNGICVIGHGSSNAIAIQNAIKVTKQAIEHDVIGKIKHSVQDRPDSEG
jgi:phosphate acyltransferase